MKQAPFTTEPAVLVLIIFLCLQACSEKADPPGPQDFQLNLNRPEIYEHEVSVNGGVVVPVDTIRWDWGDGTVSKHQFFPASHVYEQPGTYTITVTVFDRYGTTARKTVTAVVPPVAPESDEGPHEQPDVGKHEKGKADKIDTVQ